MISQPCARHGDNRSVPRFAREWSPGSIHHVIARFVNRQPRLVARAERDAYLHRMAAALRHTDWRLLGYALMSNHVHLVLQAGQAPPWRLLKPLHISVARWLNAQHGMFGPVFAERATTIALPSERTAFVLAYIHNNPVRAALVADPSESAWTSHQAYRGTAAAPPWLAVETGLRLGGFDTTPRGRLSFHRFVCWRSAYGRDSSLSGPDLPAMRSATRRACRTPVELGTPQQTQDGVTCTLYLPSLVPVRTRWTGEVDALLSAVQNKSGVRIEELRSGVKVRRVVEARRLALVTGTRLLGRQLHEIASALCMSNSAASELAKRVDRVADVAREVAAQLLNQNGSSEVQRQPSVRI